MDEQLNLESELRRRRRSRPAGEELLTAGEVAELLRMTPAWVYAETRANRLPHVRLGRYCRYRRSAIEEWIAEQEREMARRRRG